ncbi:MAG TPA: hypothetical protein VFW40_13610, partial [Capsulimonadaceae bacterium]|nr:hypothetical protein [Capsulimonadaceae bacterium]
TPTLANSELFPGTFSQGTAISEILHFTDTTTQAYTLLVGAPIQVNSTAGLFNTWTTTITGQASGTQYWDPGLGFFVKGNIVNQANVGGTLYNFNLAYSLTATNVSGG